jgi:hypothetical protein
LPAVSQAFSLRPPETKRRQPLEDLSARFEIRTPADWKVGDTADSKVCATRQTLQGALPNDCCGRNKNFALAIFHQLCQTISMKNTGAYTLRETTGTSGVDRTLRDAVALLAHHVVPHLVVGGLAVQEHGYFRVTTDCDIVVSDVLDAVELLTADLSAAA